MLDIDAPRKPTTSTHHRYGGGGGSSSRYSVTEYRDNADKVYPLTVDTSHSVEIRDEHIRQAVMAICPFLMETGDSESEEETSVDKTNHNNNTGRARQLLQVKPLSGGLSNELFIVSRRDIPSPSVLVRIHPEGLDHHHDENRDKNAGASTGTGTSTTPQVSVVNREVEVQFFAWLSQQGMAPIFYGQFQNGRIEEFYDNVAPLSHSEMALPNYGRPIAQALADFHALETPLHVLPLSKTHPKEGCRIESVDQWITAIDDPSSPHASLIAQMNKAWTWLRPYLAATNKPSTNVSFVQEKALDFIREIVVTHMDGQSLNVLKDLQENSNGQGNSNSNSNTNSSIRLIDFEYAGWNPRAADLANTFTEHCDMNNICADYDAEYPSDHVQNVFLETYVQTANPSLWKEMTKTEEDRDEFLSTLRLEIGRFTLLAHLGWAAWSIMKINEEGCTIDWDYLGYAKHRMDGFQWGKQRFCS